MLKDFTITNLGECKYDSPLPLSDKDGDMVANFVDDADNCLYELSYQKLLKQARAAKTKDEFWANIPRFEAAGPRAKIYFDPKKIKCGIVTCGGLCPGINSVIRALVMELSFWYGCNSIYGFRYGYLGLTKESGYDPVFLNKDAVDDIHMKGGTILGSSRGNQDVNKMVDRLMEFGISILFCVGGDGTLKGAHQIAQECLRRGLHISVIGIPKTIDNDIGFVEKTFGFETAFSLAVNSLHAAHVEARNTLNGVGIVKLMGRDSGYIAASAALAAQDANYVLIPEVPFGLDGENGLLEILRKRIQDRKHALVVIAEGAGQYFFQNDDKDASGNVRYGDIGIYLKERIASYFKEKKMEVNIKYIDPSYLIRSEAPIPSDSIFCATLAQNAAHAGMAGKTDMLVGIWNNHFTHVPIALSVAKRKVIDPESALWLNVLSSTGQPRIIGFSHQSNDLSNIHDIVNKISPQKDETDL